MRLDHKIALVTGASQGIGRAIATRFARAGAAVVINHLAHQTDAEKVLGEIQAAGGQGLIIQADVTRNADIRRMFDTAAAHFGQLDILVNNAGIEIEAAFPDITETDFDAVMNVNFRGAFFCAQAFVRHLRATSRPGRIINISSIHEDLPYPGHTAYCASKGALKMLTRNLAVELGPAGICINNIAPGAIETPINAALLADQTRTALLRAQIPLGRLGSTSDVAALAVFIASDEAAYITGATFYVDGGLAVHYEE
ncbi:MAG: glucose 1-dehydrogenase [Blastocatellia bacterium]